jgi:hypothetical protein
MIIVYSAAIARVLVQLSNLATHSEALSRNLSMLFTGHPLSDLPIIPNG